MREIDGVLYCNDGDWVESLTALVEHHDGRLEIIDWTDRTIARAPQSSPPQAVELKPVALPLSRAMTDPQRGGRLIRNWPTQMLPVRRPPWPSHEIPSGAREWVVRRGRPCCR